MLCLQMLLTPPLTQSLTLTTYNAFSVCSYCFIYYIYIIYVHNVMSLCTYKTYMCIYVLSMFIMCYIALQRQALQKVLPKCIIRSCVIHNFEECCFQPPSYVSPHNLCLKSYQSYFQSFYFWRDTTYKHAEHSSRLLAELGHHFSNKLWELCSANRVTLEFLTTQKQKIIV